MEQIVKEGTVCYAGAIKNKNFCNLDVSIKGLQRINMSYRPTTLMFMEVVNGEFKVSIKQIWIFALIIVNVEGKWYKKVEYIESKDEDWALEIAYLKSIDHYNDFLKLKV